MLLLEDFNKERVLYEKEFKGIIHKIALSTSSKIDLLNAKKEYSDFVCQRNMCKDGGAYIVNYLET